MDIRRIIIDSVPKELWIDLEDRHRAEAFKAHNVVKSNIALNAKRSREVEGQIRFRLQEEGFEEVVQLHGGHLVSDGIMPGTDLRVYQPFVRFQGSTHGVIMGFAAMPEPRKIPAKNKSRAAGVLLNWHFQPSMLDDPSVVHTNDVFVLFLTARDRNKAGIIEEIAVGVIGSDYKDFLFYETLEDFLRGYGDATERANNPDSPFDPNGGGADIKLRKIRKLFLPSEQRPDSGVVGDSNE